MAHPQSSPRGLFAKKRLDIGSQQLTYNSTALILSAGLRVSNAANATLTGNSTGLVVAGQVRVSNVAYVGANSTGFIFTARAAAPSTRSASKWAFITNSTGVNGVAINTTGTTWKYLNVTSVLPT